LNLQNGRPVSGRDSKGTGNEAFYSDWSEQRWGDILIGKDKCLVQVDRITVPGSRPPIVYRNKIEPDLDWPKSASIGALWDLFEGNLILAVKTSNLEIVVTSNTESARPQLSAATALTTAGDAFISSATNAATTNAATTNAATTNAATINATTTIMLL
jgi:hypothetical protein